MAEGSILIVGAGHAGAQAAVALRQQGHAGSITLVGDEPELPYERPPLSKDYLVGEKPFERMLLRPAAFWAERGVDLRLGQPVTAIDPSARVASLADGTGLAYTHLIWAAGGAPRRLSCPGADLAGLHVIRTRADTDRLTAELAAGHAAGGIVIIGGGYIGLEAAAALTKLGHAVTLVEAMPRVLARVAGEALSAFYEAEHRAHGVTVLTAAAVSHLEGDSAGRVAAVHLADGRRLSASLVLVGIGILPSIGPLAEAGAEVGNGVHVDAHGRTSLPDIFAIGDCAAQECRFADGARIRLESVQNANDQATTVARAIMGDPRPHEATPWFWSNQYDLKLQTVGLSAGHDEAILRGDPASRAFSLVYRRQGRVIALDCVNTPRDYVQGRKLVEAAVEAEAARLADPAIPLKDLLPG